MNTSSERLTLDSEKLGVEVRSFPTVGVKKSVVLHQSESIGRCLIEGSSVNGIIVTFNIVRNRAVSFKGIEVLTHPLVHTNDQEDQSGRWKSDLPEYSL